MEIVEQIPKEIFVSAHKQALENITRRDKHAYLVGMHTANMKILNKVRKTIVPPIRVYVSEITDKGVVSSNIEYRIQYNHATVPLGHVYGGSGYLCLGNIPVPAFVSPYNLMLPLETLFLYNDQNVNHGNASLKLSPKQDSNVRELARRYGLQVNTDNTNYIPYDTLWDLGAQLLELYEKSEVFKIADQLFNIVFERKD
jgi:hypothetical protein